MLRACTRQVFGAITFNSAAPKWDYAIREWKCLVCGAYEGQAYSRCAWVSLVEVGTGCGATACCVVPSCASLLPSRGLGWCIRAGLNYTMTVQVTPASENFQPAEMGVNTDWQDMYTA